MSMKRTTIDGRTVNQRTYDMLRTAQDRLGMDLRVVQGSYNRGGVAASGGTHDGGGAVDISVSGYSAEEVKDIVLQLREVGFAAWYRSSSQGPWAPHIHAIAIGDAELSSGARSQVSDYYGGRNGLANHARDDGPRLNPIPTWPIKFGKVWSGVVIWQFKVKKPKKKVSVRRTQRALKGRGYYNYGIDGVAGPKTRQAYAAFLKRRSLSGGVSRKNLRALHKGYDTVV